MDYYYRKNLQGDIIGIINAVGTELVSYSYDAWGNILWTEDDSGRNLAELNPYRYRGYYYDTETGLYYLNSRYYDPKVGRFLNADSIDYLGEDAEFSCNLYAYCANNPVMLTDEAGCLPNWLKIAIGAVATVAAVAITVATGGAVAPLLIGVAASTLAGAGISAVSHRVSTGSWEGAGEAALNGAADGFMWGGIGALGSSIIGGAIRMTKYARNGITIGKTGTFENIANMTKTEHYGGLKEFGFVKRVFGQRVAESVGWWQNKSILKGVMALKGAIYDTGGVLTGAYAKEVALTKGYEFLYNVWLM